ncbi:hypothetical protein [Bradyrhizobium sp. SZCCHNR1015]|uniref:hypothetical protein n=1 Tax=Bradyrhizobium sp. SZCCHNR1015 TaxID=3057338 RepID=UPI002916C9F6|nr:hypothetical protein [Bradyrhizobium sp. SZCCHNR1015]
MLALALIVGLISLGLMCRALFALAVHALPFFVAVSIGIALVNAGGGVSSACLAGLIAGVFTLGCGRVLFAVSRSVLVRSAVAAAFLIPAVIAGRHAALGLALLAEPSSPWRGIIGWSGALLVGLVALHGFYAMSCPARLAPSGITIVFFVPYGLENERLAKPFKVSSGEGDGAVEMEDGCVHSGGCAASPCG